MTFNFLGPGLTVNVEAKVKEQIILDSSGKNLFRVLFFLTFVISKVLPYLRILFTDQQRHFRCFLRRWWHSSIKTDTDL